MFYDASGEDDSDAFIVREDGVGISKSVWDLNVYHLAHRLGIAAHHLSLRLPKYEVYETGSQLRRAAKSTSANLVEGYGRRRYKAEYLRFLIFAKASLDETEEHLRYVQDCYPEHHAEAATLLESANLLGRKLHRFTAIFKKVKQRIPAVGTAFCRRVRAGTRHGDGAPWLQHPDPAPLNHSENGYMQLVEAHHRT